MKLNRPFQIGDCVQPSKSFQTPWNPNKRVYGRILDIEDHMETRNVAPHGAQPVLQCLSNVTMYWVVWELPFGDRYANSFLADYLEHVPPLVALADCANDLD